MAKITKDGFQIKTQNEYYEDEVQLLKKIDADWNLDPSTPDALKAAMDAERFANLDELALISYSSKDPNKATGQDLNAICALSGISRKPGTYSKVALMLTGISGTVINKGSRVASVVDGTEWAINDGVVIPAAGDVSANATCLKIGAVIADKYTITRIKDVVAGWITVTNTAVAALGLPRESDADLRLRRSRSVSKNGTNQLESMAGEIWGVSGVKGVKILENDTGAANSKGQPPHSIAVMVDGGNEKEIAKAIFRKKCPGTALHAASSPAISQVITSEKYSMLKSTIIFSRPSPIEMNVTIGVKSDGSLPSKDETTAAIRASIINYVTVVNDKEFVGFNIGSSVSVPRFYTPINAVLYKYGNSSVTSLVINTEVNEVPIDFNEVSEWKTNLILVTYT